MRLAFVISCCLCEIFRALHCAAPVEYRRQHNPTETVNRVWLRNRLTLDVKVGDKDVDFESIHQRLRKAVKKDREKLEEQYSSTKAQSYGAYCSVAQKWGKTALPMKPGEAGGNVAKAEISVVVDDGASFSREVCSGNEVIQSFATGVTILGYRSLKDGDTQVDFRTKPIMFGDASELQGRGELFYLLGFGEDRSGLKADEHYRDSELQILCTLFCGSDPQFWKIISSLVTQFKPDQIKLITLHIHSEQAPCGLCSALLTELSKQMNCARYRGAAFRDFLERACKAEEVSLTQRRKWNNGVSLDRGSVVIEIDPKTKEERRTKLTERTDFVAGKVFEAGSVLKLLPLTVRVVRRLISNIDSGKTKFLIEISSDEPDGNCALAASTDKKTLFQKLFEFKPTVITGEALSEVPEDCPLCPPNVIWMSFNPYPISDAEAEVTDTIERLKAQLDPQVPTLPVPTPQQTEPQMADQETPAPTPQQQDQNSPEIAPWPEPQVANQNSPEIAPHPERQQGQPKD